MSLVPSRRTTFGLLSAVALIFAACGTDDDGDDAEGIASTTDNVPIEDDTEQEEVYSVTYGATPAGYQTVVDRVIKDQEFDKKNGIDLQVQQVDVSQQALNLTGGLVDASFASIELVANTHLQVDDPVTCFGPLNNTFQVFGFVREDSPYETLEDLRGKKVATLDKVTAMYGTPNAVLASRGIDFDSEYLVTTGPTPAMVELFERGEVDAIIAADPPATQLLAAGDYRLFFNGGEELADILGSAPRNNCLGARQSWVTENPERTARVAQMVMDANNYVTENSAELIELYNEELGLGLDTPELKEVGAERLGTLAGPASWDDEVIETLNAYVDFLVEVGTLPERPEGDLFVNPF